MAPSQRRSQTARCAVRTELPGAAQAQRGAGHIVGCARPVQGRRTTRFLEVARAQLVPGQTGVGLDAGHVVQRQLVAQFREHLRRRGVIRRLQPLVQAAGRDVAFRVDVVPGVGRAGHEADVAGPSGEVSSAEHRGRVAVDAGARRGIRDRAMAAGVAHRAAQAPAVTHRAVAAHKEAAGRLAHAGCVAVTTELAPIAKRLRPKGISAALRQRVG
ncbi:hypothetical protein D3C72_1322900 [compost metagenome]